MRLCATSCASLVFPQPPVPVRRNEVHTREQVAQACGLGRTADEAGERDRKVVPPRRRRTRREHERGESELALADRAGEPRARRIGVDIELAPKHRAKLLVLLEGAATLTCRGIQSHQPPVRLFMRGVAPDEHAQMPDRALRIAGRLEELRELEQRRVVRRA